MSYINWIYNHWNGGTIGTWFIGIIAILVPILYTRKQRTEDKKKALKKEAQVAHSIANEFMNCLPGDPEVIKPDELMSILNSFHHSIEKAKFLIDKNNYLTLKKIRDAAIEWQRSFYQRNVCWNQFEENQSDALAYQNLNEALTKLWNDWDYLWLVLKQFLNTDNYRS